MRNCSNRFGIILAAAAFVLVLGSHGLRAQDQAALFADADGLEPPDIGVAFAIPFAGETVAGRRTASSQ